MKSAVVPTLAQVNRIMEQSNEFYANWMELNWAITFLTACRFLNLGKERANKLFDNIRREIERHDEYENVEYSMQELQAEFKRLEIPVELFGTHECWERSLRHDQLRERSKKAGIQESYEMAEKLKLMKSLL